MIPLPGIWYYILLSFISLLFLLPLLIDKIFIKKFSNSFLSTLVYPLSFVSIEYLAMIFGFGGTWFSLAYTQNNLNILQIVSIFGPFSITFLVAWFGSFVNWTWESNFNISKIKQGVLIFLSIYFFIYIYGEIRTSFFSPTSQSVRIASITRNVKNISLKKLAEGDYTRSQIEDNQHEMLQLIKNAAECGAKIIFSHEYSLNISQDDEVELIQKFQKYAADNGIYIGLGLCVLDNEYSEEPYENKIVWINSKGEIIWEYLKSFPAPGERCIAGNSDLEIIETPYTKLSSAICYDMDFPDFIRKVGQKNLDIMLVPAYDWIEISPYHTYMARLRAIENGFSIIRATFGGLSAAFDYQGRTLSFLDYYLSNKKIMISDIPSEGVTTIFSVIGNLFGWLCIIGLASIMIYSFLRKVENKNCSRFMLSLVYELSIIRISPYRPPLP